MEDHPTSLANRKLPPITGLAIAAMTMVVTSGIFTVSYLPNRPPMAVPVILLIAALLCVLVNIALLRRLHDFAWAIFKTVGGWSLLAYVVISGMLEMTFILDGTPPDILALLTFSLLLYAIDIPVLFAFSVARYQPAQ